MSFVPEPMRNALGAFDAVLAAKGSPLVSAVTLAALRCGTKDAPSVVGCASPAVCSGRLRPHRSVEGVLAATPWPTGLTASCLQRTPGRVAAKRLARSLLKRGGSVALTKTSASQKARRRTLHASDASSGALVPDFGTSPPRLQQSSTSKPPVAVLATASSAFTDDDACT